ADDRLMGQGEGRNDGAIGLGFVSQRAQSNRRGVAMDSRDHAGHRVQQQLRLALSQPAAKDDQVRVKNSYEVRYCYAHHGEGLFEDGAGLAVSLARRLKHEPGVALFSQGRALSFGGRAEDFAARGGNPQARDLAFKVADFAEVLDRKSTRLNSSHVSIS